MHGLRVELMQRQLTALGLPAEVLELPEQPSMEVYDHLMNGVVRKLKKEGYADTAFGDIFLEDLRTYREQQLEPLGMKCIFPLWKRNTTELIDEFIDLGFRAIVICAKDELLGADFVGKEINKDFVASLPTGVDPCGEHGEFHTFCFDGPIFSKPIEFTIGEKTYREYDNPDPKSDVKTGFWFLDLV